ncbi:MAG: exo-beta-N-acetylmuramidase NamZ domain-containing protein [Elusimicrobiota bacterium]
MHKFKTLLFTVFFFTTSSFAAVKTGLDVLREENFESLRGKKIALITNQTGVTIDGKSAVDLFYKTKGIKLVNVMSPEHGFRGNLKHGEKVEDSKDSRTGIHIYSLYGKTQRPTSEMLEGVDTIIFDIQDIGTRYYTYITTMGMALEEAAKRKIKFVVLDRPNPIRGDMTDGDILDPEIKRMTGYFPIPTRHGLTIGELANWMNAYYQLKADLVIVRMEKWKRIHWYDETGLQFIPPSPNIRNLTQALLYSGIGCFEATNISVGRGTETPFEIFGAPWINSKELIAYLRAFNFPGVIFEPVEFVPLNDIYANEKCNGVKMIVTNRKDISPFQIFIASFWFMHQNYTKELKFDWEELRIVTGSNLLKDFINEKKSLESLLSEYNQKRQIFIEQVKQYFLY